MSEVGCVPPYIPIKMAKDYPVCNNDEDGKKAFDIYEKYSHERFKNGTEVWTS